MAMNSIWWEIARSSDEVISEFVQDLQLNVEVIPFDPPRGTNSDEGAFSTEELREFFKGFAREIAQMNISEVKQ